MLNFPFTPKIRSFKYENRPYNKKLWECELNWFKRWYQALKFVMLNFPFTPKIRSFKYENRPYNNKLWECDLNWFRRWYQALKFVILNFPFTPKIRSLDVTNKVYSILPHSGCSGYHTLSVTVHDYLYKTQFLITNMKHDKTFSIQFYAK